MGFQGLYSVEKIKVNEVLGSWSVHLAGWLGLRVELFLRQEMRVLQSTAMNRRWKGKTDEGSRLHYRTGIAMTEHMQENLKGQLVG